MTGPSEKFAIVIPARLASTRLPEKLLLQAGGKSILQHTYEAASRSSLASEVIVAVDDPRLAAEVDRFGGTALLTSPACQSGSDRLAEVAQQRPDIGIFINVQGDEPETDALAIDRMAAVLLSDPSADMATVARPIRDLETLQDPSRVKIAIGSPAGRLVSERRAGEGSDAGAFLIGPALYFSRSVIPYVREGISESILAANPPVFWHHLGLYAYRREFLLWFASQPPSPLEKLERLEQLRALEGGKRILVARVEHATPGIDTLEDFRAFVARLGAGDGH